MYTRDAHINPASELWTRMDKVSEQDEWSIVDDLLLHNMRHSFVARLPNEKAPWRIDFEGKDWQGYKPVAHPSLSALDGGNFQRGQFRFTLSAPEQTLLQGVNGKNAISTLLAKLGQSGTPVERREIARTFFRRMARMGHLFYRTA